MLYYRMTGLEDDERVIVDENGRIVIFTALPDVSTVLRSLGAEYVDSNPQDYTTIMQLWGSVDLEMVDSTSSPGSWELMYGENVYYINKSTYDITPRPSTEYPG